MDKIFYPRNLVVIGVSERQGNLAGCIVGNLREFGYTGDVYAVGPRGGQVHGVTVHPSLEGVPDGLDLAVILTPAPSVPDLLDQCGRKGITRAVIESGGFAEFSAAGVQLEQELCRVASRHGIRFVGPNCISVINLENGLCLPFALLKRSACRSGPVAVLAQSGGVTVTYLLMLSQAGLGVSKLVSMGNKLDLDECDLLAYLLADPQTELILLYLESIEDGRRLAELVRGAPKPVLLHKTNTGRAATQIAQSHTAALANDDRVVNAVARQVGIVRGSNFRAMVNLAKGFRLPPVRGREIVILSRSGGHAVHAADAAERLGFHLADLPPDFVTFLEERFRAGVIAPTNPVDLGTIFAFDQYAAIAEEALCRVQPDALLVIHTYSSWFDQARSRSLASRLADLARRYDCPIAYCPYSEREEQVQVERELGYPVFDEIDDALAALAASRDWHARHAVAAPVPAGALPTQVSGTSDGLDWEKAARILEGSDSRPLLAQQALQLLSACGIPVADWAVVHSPDQGVLLARRMGWPVVLKVLSPTVSHKSDAGGVLLSIRSGKALRRAYDTLLQRVPDTNGILIQRQVQEGYEVIIGGRQDAAFGPLVMFGMGGIYVELLDDVAFRMAPITRADALSMIDEVRGSRLLRGARGRPPADLEVLADALVRLGTLLVDFPQVAEIDVNPLLVGPAGVVAVDARVAVAPV